MKHLKTVFLVFMLANIGILLVLVPLCVYNFKGSIEDTILVTVITSLLFFVPIVEFKQELKRHIS